MEGTRHDHYVQQRPKANAAVEKAQADRVSSYTGSLKVAVTMGAEDFDAAMEALFEGIRINRKVEGHRQGLAVRAAAKPGKKDDTWIVPQSLSTARSVIKDAYEYGIPMLDADSDDLEAVRSFGAIRKDVKEAKLALAQAERTTSELERDALVDQLRAMAEEIAKEDPDLVMAASYTALVTQLDDWVMEHDAIAGEAPEAEEQQVEAAAA
jgi:hypothetical protein